MSLIETLTIEVGSSIAKSILKLWIKDSTLDADMSSSMIDLLKSRTTDRLAQQRALRQFQEIGEKVGESLQPIVEAEGGNLDEGSLTAIALAVAETFNKTNLSSEVLAQNDLEPRRLAKYLLTNHPSAIWHFNSAETLLYQRLISESCEYIVDIASQLPAFTENTFAEVLKREGQLLGVTEQILQEVHRMREQLNPIAEAARFELEYRRTVVRNLDVLQLFGVNVSTASRRYRLSLAYITLQVRQKLLKNLSNSTNKLNITKFEKSEDEINKDTVSIDEALASGYRMLIHGLAGSGKTTLLQWIAVNSASKSFGGHLTNWNDTIPFYIRLRQYIQTELPAPEDFPRMIARTIADTMPKGWVHAELISGRAIVLVDGLDEVPMWYREEVRTWIKDLLEIYPLTRIIVTSRLHAVEEGWMAANGFIDVELQPMELPMVNTFIDHWYTAVSEELHDEEEKAKLPFLAQQLKKDIADNRLKHDLATNPLLCAMLCALSRDQQLKLLSSRIELYEAYCRMLIESRDKEQRTSLTDYPFQILPYRQKRILLEDFAYWLIKNGKSAVEVKYTDERFTRKLTDMQGILQEITGTDARRFFVERTAILSEPSSGLIAFTFHTLREYLAARAILDEDDIDALVQYAHDTQWQEVIILATDMATRRGVITLISGIFGRAAEYAMAGDYTQAEQLYQLVLNIQSASSEAEHPEIATALYNVAAFYMKVGKYGEAEALYHRVLDIQHAALIAGHPDIAATLYNLGTLYASMGKYVEAESFYQQTLDMQRIALGSMHPRVATTTHSLARLYAATGRYTEAFDMMKQAIIIEDRLIEHIAWVTPEDQRVMYFKALQRNMDVFLSLVFQYFPSSHEAIQTALDLVLKRKIIEKELLITQRNIFGGNRHADLISQLEELSQLSMQMIHLFLDDSGWESSAVQQQLLIKTNAQKELLEAELAEQIPEIRLTRQLRTFNRQVIARLLPREAAMVEFVRLDVFDFHAIPAQGEMPWKPAHYLAFVFLAKDPNNVRMVDLGEINEIDELITAFQEELMLIGQSEGSTDQLLFDSLRIETEAKRHFANVLRETIFDPLLEAFSDCKYIIFAPTGALCRVSFAILPTSSGMYLIDDYHFSYLHTVRDVLRFGIDYNSQPSRSIVIADPDFDLEGDSSSEWLITKEEQSRQIDTLYRNALFFKRKSGTREEGEKIAALLDVRPWLGDNALKTSLRASHSPYILHMATASFFLSHQKIDLNMGSLDVNLIEWTNNVELKNPSFQEVKDSLLLSGLALAGANAWLKSGNPHSEVDNGLLTAEDVSRLDLAGTSLVVISTYETGEIEERISEGILELQRSFLLAGAKVVVMNLSQIASSDKANKWIIELLEDFYRRILDGKTPIQALREAQLFMKSRYSDPSSWGTFICVADISPLPMHTIRFVKAVDPYVVGLPAEGPAFVGRHDILTMIQDNLALSAGKNILVLRGQRRTGKTSVLFRLRDTLPKEKHSTYLPVLVDMQGMAGIKSESEFFFRMARFIWEDLDTYGVKVSKPRLSNFMQAPTSVFEFDFLDDVAGALGDRRVLLMIDEFDKIKELIDNGPLGSEVLDYYRHLMQHSSLLFLIAGTHRLREFTGGYWTVFFNLAVPVDIDALTEGETRRLITEPINLWYTIETSAVNEIVRIAGRHPFFTQLVCKKLLEVRNEYKLNFMTMVHVEEAFARALQSGDDQIGYPWTEKDCSADERLVLSAMASECVRSNSVQVTMIQKRITESGFTAEVNLAIKKLLDQGVVRQDAVEKLTFAVPLFQRWIVRNHYHKVDKAAHYNKARQSSGISGGKSYA